MLIYEDPALSDLDELTELYETYLNAGESIRDYMREGLEDPEMVGVKCVNTKTGKIVGILYAQPGVRFTCDHPELARIIRRRWGTEGVYTGEMLVVDPAYRSHGIARELAVQLRQRMIRKGAVCMVMEQWLRSKKRDVPAMNPMRSAGDAILVAVSQNFYKDLPKYGMTCPECGVECKCGAVVSVIDFRYPYHYPESEEEGYEEG